MLSERAGSNCNSAAGSESRALPAKLFVSFAFFAVEDIFVEKGPP